MSKVLCFGDSNTWGYSPTTGQRMPADSRWPRVMASLLGEAYQIIEAGQPGRTTYPNSPDFGLSRGIEALLQEASKHQPEWLLLMLGTNDLYPAFHLSAEQISNNLEQMIVELGQHCVSQGITSPQVLLLAPPAIDETGHFGQHFTGSQAKSQQLAGLLEAKVNKLSCAFFDVNSIINLNQQDGVHLSPEQHKQLAETLALKLAFICQ
ncbi:MULTISPECIES: GDSL-type esterase/lipase family protein [unclassified Agarivorans]|uniref:GDSL-type esterase/lipase family protein n=1 Tax=unclassified Agarivorans TaxID=2636026 RepID=UPI0026E159BD|nr:MULTISPECIES: GDSL-type esterase/lipase family protein [unclassified Agarivorans]MDO6684892.1 GDSL-type esterase/lipase family protein [Agarivorans sp. 3_MG-2023]MDO6714947.1 GDSL-type esterase/lipase family protein [Agarivorans sp. 2_MG-2023]